MEGIQVLSDTVEPSNRPWHHPPLDFFFCILNEKYPDSEAILVGYSLYAAKSIRANILRELSPFQSFNRS